MPNNPPPIDSIKKQIKQRLSLRKPQIDALDLLADCLGRIEFSKEADIAKSLKAIQSIYPSVKDFERDFPSLCFALATGVGKTRLMGAFVAYLFLTKRTKHFMILAPNTVIYEKLITDFSQGSAKYVFRGIAELTHNAPVIVTGDNWDNGRGVQGPDLFDNPIINIFNVDKINKDKGRIHNMQEYIGQSYFKYLCDLPDLVVLMDEAHRYRAKAGMKAIAGLKPVLGLEVTATPKTTGNKPKDFKNIIYHYPLGQAMADGFVKEPAIATRANFKAQDVTEEQLQQIKLEDGVRCHENTRAELITYANNNDLHTIKPFMLIVAQDTTHSRQILQQIQADSFYNGAYKDKVIEINSALASEESEEATRRLLELEHTKETEIVIHVNKLKEGWDVTNLYTIIPLRASASDILTEQTLGRGLRLPYGRRTNNEVVDRLTVIAHDRFDQVIAQAKAPDSIIQMKSVLIGDKNGVPSESTTAIKITPHIETILTGESVSFDGVAEPASTYMGASPPEPMFKTPQDQKLAEITYQVIQKDYEQKCQNGLSDLKTDKMIADIAKDVRKNIPFTQDSNKDPIKESEIENIVSIVTEQMEQHIIEIPEIVIMPTDDIHSSFNDFDLSDVQSINFQPVHDEVKIRELRTSHEETLSGMKGEATDNKLEDYIIRYLKAKDIIDYASNATLLYKLIGQAVTHIKSYINDPADQENVCIYHGEKIADFIFGQMMDHYQETSTDYQHKVIRGFTVLKPQNYNISKDRFRDFKHPANPISETRSYLFRGFHKCCFSAQRFDSEPERQFAELIDSTLETSVIKWMKPAENQFKIEYEAGHKYHPDFVIETDDAILIAEVKAKNEMNDPIVLKKAEATSKWVYYANQVSKEAGKKRWDYLLIPHDEIKPSSTLAGLKAGYTRPEFSEK